MLLRYAGVLVVLKRRQYFNVYFNVDKYSDLANRTIISYTLESDKPYSIKASPMGITFDGKLEITSEEDLRDFARLIADVWNDHQKLAPKIITGTGH